MTKTANEMEEEKQQFVTTNMSIDLNKEFVVMEHIYRSYDDNKQHSVKYRLTLMDARNYIIGLENCIEAIYKHRESMIPQKILPLSREGPNPEEWYQRDKEMREREGRNKNGV